eukprot:SM000034S12778  [mRNA]  locus=s34:765248:768397:+ [translate_table: standard]
MVTADVAWMESRRQLEGGPVAELAEIRLFDAHCHLQDPRLGGQLERLLADAGAAGVRWLVTNGTSESDWDHVRELGERHEAVIPSFGLHPRFVQDRSSSWLTKLKNLLLEVPGAAVGEVGIDKSPRGQKADLAVQIDVMRQQLQLAQELNRPVAVHCVRAYGDLENTLRTLGDFPAGLILHSYMGSAAMVDSLCKQGAYFSFSGFITHMKAKKASQILHRVPMTRLLLETDAPDAFPAPEECEAEARGPEHGIKNGRHQSASDADAAEAKYNTPANLAVVLKKVATLMGKPQDEVAEAAYENALRLFSFDSCKVQS